MFYGEIAQLARAIGSYPIGQEFESLSRYQIVYSKSLFYGLVLILLKLIIFNATISMGGKMKDINLLINGGINVNSSLELFSNIETYEENLDNFLKNIKERTKNLNEYKEKNDMRNFNVLIESLKFESKLLGFNSLFEMCIKHSVASKNNYVTFISDNFNELIDEINRVIMLCLNYFGISDSNDYIVSFNSIKKNECILVVDDSDIIRSFIKHMLDSSYEIKVAKDGTEALYILSNQKISGMFLDLEMPNVNGFEVLNYMDKNNLFDNIPVTVITGVDGKLELDKLSMYPLTDVLLKPFNEKSLRDSIDKMLKK